MTKNSQVFFKQQLSSGKTLTVKEATGRDLREAMLSSGGDPQKLYFTMCLLLSKIEDEELTSEMFDELPIDDAMCITHAVNSQLGIIKKSY